MATATGLGWGNTSPFQVTHRRGIIANWSSNYGVRNIRRQQGDKAMWQTLFAAHRSVVHSNRLASLAWFAVLFASNKSLREPAVANLTYANCVNSRTFFSVPERVDTGFAAWSPHHRRHAIGQPLSGGGQNVIQTTGQLWPRYR
jgi:hypothetical protein